LREPTKECTPSDIIEQEYRCTINTNTGIWWNKVDILMCKKNC